MLLQRSSEALRADRSRWSDDQVGSADRLPDGPATDCT